MQREVNLNIPPDLRPVYAEEVNVNAGIKVNVEKDEDGKEKITKIATINLMFFDNLTKTVVARVVIDAVTAKALSNILAAQTTKLMEEVNKKEIPEHMKKRIEQKPEAQEVTSTSNYIG